MADRRRDVALANPRQRSGRERLAVARALKAEDRFAALPIIVLTGQDDTRRGAIDASDDDLILKPLRFGEVDTRIRTPPRSQARSVLPS